MIKVTCEVEDYSGTPKKANIIVRNYWCDSKMVEIEVNGVKFVVSGKDMIQAIQNCTNNNLCF